jgi:hypothetical protein
LDVGRLKLVLSYITHTELTEGCVFYRLGIDDELVSILGKYSPVRRWKIIPL